MTIFGIEENSCAVIIRPQTNKVKKIFETNEKIVLTRMMLRC